MLTMVLNGVAPEVDVGCRFVVKSAAIGYRGIALMIAPGLVETNLKLWERKAEQEN